eukprot:2689888-Prymnesium_polylepis.1
MRAGLAPLPNCCRARGSGMDPHRRFIVRRVIVWGRVLRSVCDPRFREGECGVAPTGTGLRAARMGRRFTP